MSITLFSFLIAIIALIIISLITCIIGYYTDDKIFPGICVLIIFVPITAFICCGVVSPLTTTKNKATNYDCSELYVQFQGMEVYECAKQTILIDDYYKYNTQKGIYLNTNYIDKITVIKTVTGYKAVYYDYEPSEKAEKKKTEWEKIERFRLQKDAESKPSEEVESNQNKEQE